MGESKKQCSGGRPVTDACAEKKKQGGLQINCSTRKQWKGGKEEQMVEKT